MQPHETRWRVSSAKANAGTGPALFERASNDKRVRDWTATVHESREETPGSLLHFLQWLWSALGVRLSVIM